MKPKCAVIKLKKIFYVLPAISLFTAKYTINLNDLTLFV